MSGRYIFFVLLAIIATQTAQAANDVVATSSYRWSLPTKDEVDLPDFQDLPAKPVTDPRIRLELAGMDAQSLPQGQAPPSHSAHHTLRNILIIFVAVALMFVALGAAAK